eukprot:1160909-Pelagomonas_calceolata.AAC.7
MDCEHLRSDNPSSASQKVRPRLKRTRKGKQTGIELVNTIQRTSRGCLPAGQLWRQGMYISSEPGCTSLHLVEHQLRPTRARKEEKDEEQKMKAQKAPIIKQGREAHRNSCEISHHSPQSRAAAQLAFAINLAVAFSPFLH